MQSFLINISLWQRILVWCLLFIIIILLFSFFEKRKRKISKILSIVFAFILILIIVIPIIECIIFIYPKIKLMMIHYFSEVIAISALIVSVLSLCIGHIFFDKKVLIKKGTNDKGVYIKIENTSNKNIEILNFFVDGTELIANPDEEGKKTEPIEVDGIKYMMFNRIPNTKVCKGSSLKIQYVRNEGKNDFKTLRFGIRVEYKTLGKLMTKLIETDLSPFI